MNCIFCQIKEGNIPSDFLYEDEQVFVIKDINPQAPQHLLIIPKTHIATLNELSPQNNALIGHMILTGKQLAEKMGVAEDGYRLVFNCNQAGGQAVYHIHLHLLGGRQMDWPPG